MTDHPFDYWRPFAFTVTKNNTFYNLRVFLDILDKNKRVNSPSKIFLITIGLQVRIALQLIFFECPRFYFYQVKFIVNSSSSSSFSLSLQSGVATAYHLSPNCPIFNVHLLRTNLPHIFFHYI